MLPKWSVRPRVNAFTVTPVIVACVRPVSYRSFRLHGKPWSASTAIVTDRVIDRQTNWPIGPSSPLAFLYCISRSPDGIGQTIIYGRPM